MEIKEDHLINIHHFLPHREPMLMADYILELTKEKVVTSFEIKEDNIFVHNGEFVEAGLIENLAQTCSSILGQSFFENPEADTKVIGFITNIKKIKLFGLPKTGDKIISKASLISQYENICTIFCETFNHDELLIRAEINLFIQEVKS
ncbi:ABC transporter permease [Chryseobacterium shigense]|uniref:3-hydroxymyristoyl/3-hydroxydecanoyl-(Acyl carrier protein) dehydratase n=1 Tax=Chryseobacterium shigense TaxID=297244 RepID=A0A1N7J8Y3_9FLAO|nr:ABC transporter permease [Chryseobacterium shigense]PQA93507.1 ABC transporter permease [Chryseobacterium shigense]SIS45731.1 3-hydroxymyristoyl/3-hydroxydecanoyl-(acyl carrier protein) dehydratase [Chryseobacterium shigense]